jgi:hypothetical protein
MYSGKEWQHCRLRASGYTRESRIHSVIAFIVIMTTLWLLICTSDKLDIDWWCPLQILFPTGLTLLQWSFYNTYHVPTQCICVSCEVRTAHSVSVCSVLFSQQTATVTPHSINRLGSVSETWCVSCEVRTAHNLSVCSVRFSQQTTVSPHSIKTGWALYRRHVFPVRYGLNL